MRKALDDHGLVLSALAYYDNNLVSDAAEREGYHAHLRACIDAAAALGVPVGTFIGRDPDARLPRTFAKPNVSFRRSSTTRASAACV